MLIFDLELNVAVRILFIRNFFVAAETDWAFYDLLQRLKWELLISLKILYRMLECELFGLLI